MVTETKDTIKNISNCLGKKRYILFIRKKKDFRIKKIHSLNLKPKSITQQNHN